MLLIAAALGRASCWVVVFVVCRWCCVWCRRTDWAANYTSPLWDSHCRRQSHYDLHTR